MKHSADRSDATSVARWILAITIAVIGLAVFVYGIHLETQNPRTNAEDDFAWFVLAVGTAMTAAGIAMPFLRLKYVAVVAVVAPPVAFSAAVVVIWTLIILNAVFRLEL